MDSGLVVPGGNELKAGYAPSPPARNQGENVLSNGIKDPTCMVEFECPLCSAVVVKDAYLGAVSCAGGGVYRERPDVKQPKHRSVPMEQRRLVGR